MADEQPRTVQRICPLLSSAITYEVLSKDGKRKERVHRLAQSGCLGGVCMLYNIRFGRCGLLGGESDG